MNKLVMFHESLNTASKKSNGIYHHKDLQTNISIKQKNQNSNKHRIVIKNNNSNKSSKYSPKKKFQTVKSNSNIHIKQNDHNSKQYQTKIQNKSHNKSPTQNRYKINGQNKSSNIGNMDSQTAQLKAIMTQFSQSNHKFFVKCVKTYIMSLFYYL